MKGMKFLSIEVICLFLTVVCGVFLLSKPSDAEDAEALNAKTKLESLADVGAEVEELTPAQTSASSWVSPPIPFFLEKYFDKSDVNADTICVVDGETYYFCYDNCRKSCVIYTLHDVLCEDPTLTFDTLNSSSMKQAVVATTFKSVSVDFSNKKSIAQLKELTPVLW